MHKFDSGVTLLHVIPSSAVSSIEDIEIILKILKILKQCDIGKFGNIIFHILQEGRLEVDFVQFDGPGFPEVQRNKNLETRA